MKKTLKGSLEDYRERFVTIAKGTGNNDIYPAFIEQGLRLAGNHGQIAYIQPSFARKQAMKTLRDYLVDYLATSMQILMINKYSTASNYIAFWRPTKRKSKPLNAVNSLDLKSNEYDQLDLEKWVLGNFLNHQEI